MSVIISRQSLYFPVLILVNVSPPVQTHGTATSWRQRVDDCEVMKLSVET